MLAAWWYRKQLGGSAVSGSREVACSCCARNFHFVWGGYSPGGLGTEVPSGVQGRSPGSGSGLPDAEEVCRHCLQILTAVTIKIKKKIRTIRLLFLDHYVSRWAKRYFWGSAPLAHAWHRHLWRAKPNHCIVSRATAKRTSYYILHIKTRDKRLYLSKQFRIAFLPVCFGETKFIFEVICKQACVHFHLMLHRLYVVSQWFSIIECN